jgi:LacI family transcriptional regulator
MINFMDLERRMTSSKPERVSIAEVAKVANVSMQTVSRVINEQPGVSLATRERILQVIDDLGYYPSRAAKALRGSSKTLGIVGYGLELFGPSRTLVGAQREASRANYGVVLELIPDPQSFDPRHILEKMLSNHVDGIVWCIPHIADNIEKVVVHLEKIPVPVIFTDTSAEMHDLTVTNNNYQGGKIATQHLLEAGHPTVAIITGPLSYFAARERLRGWGDALRQARLSVNEDGIVEGDWNAASGASGLNALLQRCPDLSAVFACNDQMALGVLHAAEQHGLVVPRDLAVVGYDDIPEAAFFHPPLSSVHQNVVELGASAVSQLIRAIDSLAIRGRYASETTALEPELVIRASSMTG